MKRTKQSRRNSDTLFNEVPIPEINPEDLFFPEEEEPKVSEYRKSHAITLLGTKTNYRPIEEFSEKFFPKDLLSITTKFKTPTPIQSQTWPILLNGDNAVGIAQTGSGKTLAFGLPGILSIKKTTKFGDPIIVRMLVLAPTRELATQIEEVLSEAGKASGVKVVCLYGGAPRNTQLNALKEGAHVIVATPGRLKDFLHTKQVDLGKVNFLVLDEADRMLDMGFEPDIRHILGFIPKEHQTAMFSATWPNAIKKLSEQFITDPVRVTIGSTEGKLVANSNVTQIIEVIEENSRDTKLITLLQKYHVSRTNRIIIFVLYKREASRLENWLYEEGWNCVAIHSDKKQNARFAALDSFKSGEIPLLIATDVAARGLDIPQVEYVINYSFPLTVEDYVHRIGRTGRAGNTGIAHTFFVAHANKQHAGSLVNVLKRTNQTVPESLKQFDLSVKKKEPILGKINLVETAAKHVSFSSDSSDSE